MIKIARGDKKLGYLCHQKINSLLRIGESKHLAKQESKAEAKAKGEQWNPAKVEGIYSISTAENYRQVINEFCKWHFDKGYKQYVPNLKSIPKERVIEYLKHRDKICSPWSVSKDMAALNKVFGYNITKKEAGLKLRSLKNITRSRTPAKADSRDYSKHKEAIIIAKATGIRRESVTKIQPEDFSRNKYGLVTHVAVIEKGGKYREAPILQEYREKVTNIVNSKPVGKPMFSTYAKNIDNHSYRAEYAKKYYEEQLKEQGAGSKQYRGYDKEAVQKTSLAIGHNRLGVTVDHYLNK